MVRRIEWYSTRGWKPLNEDATTINMGARVFAVMDGATSVVDWRNRSGETGGFLASHLFQRHFDSVRLGCDLPSEIISANTTLRRAMEEEGIPQNQKEALWCTCIAAVAVNERRVQFGHLGDCMVIVRSRDGGVRVVTHDTVEGISERARIHLRQLGDGSLIKRYEESHEFQRVYNRSLANVAGGYSVANGMTEVANMIQFGELALTEVSQVLLVSDGLFPPEHHPTLRGNWQSVLNAIGHCGLRAYIQNLQVFEDVTGIRPDDKTAVLITF